MGFPDPVLQPWELRALHPLRSLSSFPPKAWFVSVIEKKGSALATFLRRNFTPYFHTQLLSSYGCSIRVEEWRVVWLNPTPSAEV